MNSISFRASNQSLSSNQTRIQSTINSKQENQSNTKAKLIKTIPYAIGTLGVLAIAYKMRGQISKLFKQSSKTHTIPNIELTESTNHLKQNGTPNLPAVIYHHNFTESKPAFKFEPTPELRAQIKGEKPFRFKLNQQEENVLAKEKPLIADSSKEIEHNTQQITEGLSEEFKEICIGFDKEGKPIYDLVEMPSQNDIVKSAYKEAFESISFNDKNTIDKIKNTRIGEQDNINKIIKENTHNDNVDMSMMKKVATDYMLDTNRGENRFHQAADLLEQAYIKQHLKGDGSAKSGMYNLVDGMTTDPVLYQCYQNMPLQESANRLNYLKEHDLGNYTYKESMNPEGFFEKTFNKLVEKYQMKRYNETHGIN